MNSVVSSNEKVTVKPDFDIVAGMAEDFKRELEVVVQADLSNIIIDLINVEMIDSIGLGVLIGVHNKLRKNGGRLTVKNLSDDILALFRTMRLNTHFEVLGKHN